MKKSAVCLAFFGAITFGVTAAETKKDESSEGGTLPPAVEKILSQVTQCSPSVQLRTQSLPEEKKRQACNMLKSIEDKFHSLFHTRGKPVSDDNNTFLRANIYHTRDDYVKFAPAHFNMTTNNGGMYLEGHPERKDNQAEFVAYERNGEIWNLRHEFVHYLDGRFNQYGDFCNGLHDDHSEPEACPKPNRPYPHAVWWSEGIAEYIAKDEMDAPIKKVMQGVHFKLSEIFNTSYHQNAGTERVYRWGYLAVRFMMENHRPAVEQMLLKLRSGDFDGYQAVVRSWGTQFDDGFQQWLQEKSKN